MNKFTINLFEDSMDTISQMLIGYVLYMPDTNPRYNDKVAATIEFLEQGIDPSFNSVACYFSVLNLLPETTKRKIPYALEEFIRMYQDQIETALGGPIPEKYRPGKILALKKSLVDAVGRDLMDLN